MKRKIYQKLLAWKQERKGDVALLIEGARRVGKSHIVEEFARNEYDSYILVDFSTVNPQVIEFFNLYLDDLAFMIMATPIFYPAIVNMNYDPIWACIMISLTVCVGSVIPPVAMCVFVVKNITKVPMNIIYQGVYPFLISLILCVVLLFIFPQLTLYLPGIFMK